MLLIWFLIAAVGAYYWLWQAIQGREIELRDMGAIRGIEEGIDRAVEMGKPVLMSPGDIAFLSGQYAPMTIAGMNVMRYAARMAVQRDVRPIFGVPCQPDALPLIDGIYREVCMAEGKPEAYDRGNVNYWGSEWQNYSSGMANIIDQQRPALFLIVGACTGSGSEFPAGMSRWTGAITILNTARYWMIPRVPFYSDYPHFGDDIYALGALCTGDPVVASPIIGGDILKILLFAVTLIGGILQLAGVPFLDWLAI